jgi:hypothetical protein
VKGVHEGDGAGVRGENTTSGQAGKLGGGYYGVKADGDLVVTGAYKGTIGPNDGAPFPRPAYDSWWQPMEPGDFLTLGHEIGGDVSDYVVDLQYKESGSLGINNKGQGGYGITVLRGAYWYDLTSAHISVALRPDDTLVDHVRVRIWVYN